MSLLDKVRIGVVAARAMEDGRPFKDRFCFVNNFVRRIDECGAIAYGVLFPSGVFKEEYLDIYDGFLFHSGKHVCLFQLLVLHYAIIHNKPVLGICLGAQVIGAYDYVVSNLRAAGKVVNYQNISSFCGSAVLDDGLFMQKVSGHDLCPIYYYDSIGESKHGVRLVKGSIIYSIFGKDVISMPSLHNWVLKGVYSDFRVTGYSDDGYIEVIESLDRKLFVLGVQFHAELEEDNLCLFERFIKEVEQRKKC